ncbi:MAG: cupin domain-containing protein [Geminicoccaceae bacterium]|nr:cupin domain-containing protein [Geminicoccaceae bacterium]
MPDLQPNPWRDDRCQKLRFADDGRIPNNPDFPALACAGALPAAGLTPEAAIALLRRNGWGGAWTNGVFSYHHYHSRAHEVLVVTGGGALLRLGGEAGEDVRVTAGDLLLLPAGTGHRRLDADAAFTVVGAYPPGQEDYDVLRGDPAERPAALERIGALPIPPTDPLYGGEGPLLGCWR